MLADPKAIKEAVVFAAATGTLHKHPPGEGVWCHWRCQHVCVLLQYVQLVGMHMDPFVVSHLQSRTPPPARGLIHALGDVELPQLSMLTPKLSTGQCYLH